MTIAGPWYQNEKMLRQTRRRGPQRRIAVVLLGAKGIARQGVAAAVQRCGHKHVGANDAPDLIIANWWKWDMGALTGFPSGVPVVHAWVGSDVHHTTAHSKEERFNWVASPWLARLLRQRLGITAHMIPHTPALEPRLLERSPTRRVLTYCPERREHKYCWDGIVEIASRCPGLEFHVLLKGGHPPVKNMVHLPRVKHGDMPAIYAGTRVLLRLTPSDGISQSVMEALGFGRHAVWNWWAPGVTHVSSIGEAIEAIRRLVDAAPYAGGVASALEFRAQADYSMCAAIENALS